MRTHLDRIIGLKQHKRKQTLFFRVWYGNAAIDEGTPRMKAGILKLKRLSDMTQKEKDSLYTGFKHEEMPIFKWIAISQGIVFGLMIIGAILIIWINLWLILKIEATLFVTALIVGIIYSWLDALTRKQFDKSFDEDFI